MTASLIATAFAGGCAFKVEKGQAAVASDNQANSPAPDPNVILGFDSLKTRVFAPQCLRCHSAEGGNKGDVNLETYASAAKVLDRIENEVLDEKSMPPTGPLSDADQNLVREWLEAGAPEKDVPRTSARPTPLPTPTSTDCAPAPGATAEGDSQPQPVLSPSPDKILGYDSLRSLILAKQCLRCHSEKGGNKGDVNLETYESAIPVVDRIMNEVVVEQSMPPKGPLSSVEQTLVKEWINAGAPEQDIERDKAPAPKPTVAPSPVVTPSPTAEPAPEPSVTPSLTPEPQPTPSVQPSPIVTPTLTPTPTPTVTVTPTPTPTLEPHKILFDEVNARVFAPQCLRCHDSRSGHPKKHVSVNTYADVVKFLKRIRNEAIVEKSMPPRGPLSDADQQLLETWIEEGAPQ